MRSGEGGVRTGFVRKFYILRTCYVVAVVGYTVIQVHSPMNVRSQKKTIITLCKGGGKGGSTSTMYCSMVNCEFADDGRRRSHLRPWAG